MNNKITWILAGAGLLSMLSSVVILADSAGRLDGLVRMYSLAKDAADSNSIMSEALTLHGAVGVAFYLQITIGVALALAPAWSGFARGAYKILRFFRGKPS